MKHLLPWLLMVVLVLTACGGNADVSPVSPVGKWSQDNGDYYDFRENGEVIYAQGGYVYGGANWAMNAETVEITSLGSVMFKGTITGNELTIWAVSNPSNRKTFTREP